MIRISTAITASSNNRCNSPPSVYDVTIPSSHIITRITAIVQSMLAPFPISNPLTAESLFDRQTNFEQASQPRAFQHVAKRFAQTTERESDMLLSGITQSGQQCADTGTVHVRHVAKIQNEARPVIGSEQPFDLRQQIS